MVATTRVRQARIKDWQVALEKQKMLAMKGFLESEVGVEIRRARTRYEKYNNSSLRLGDATSSLKQCSVTLWGFFVMKK